MDAIALIEPSIDDDLRLLGGVEPFGIEDFSTQCAIEAFVVAILPPRSRVDMDRRDAQLSQSVLQGYRNELCAVHLRFDRDTQSFAGVFIQHRQHLVGPSVAQLIVDKVDAPDVIGILWAQPDDGTVFVVQPLPFPMSAWEL